MTEKEWDSLLKIHTSGRDASRADTFRYPYEPTPYRVLERLAASGLITRDNHLLDYGSGKGRAGFFLSWQTRCRCTGIEYDERLLEAALKNREKAAGGAGTSFVLSPAEDYEVPADADRAYFFNPFSAELLQKVLFRIRTSWYLSPRDFLLFFYYPSEEYLGVLMTEEALTFEDEIDCRDLFPGRDTREEILVFSLDG